jgi:hypothetical protein
MLHKPKKRNWPSRNSSSRWKVRRQPPGDTSGSRPSKTSTNASAYQNGWSKPLRPYFFAADAAAPVLLRNALKNSEPLGSTTSRSLFLLKLTLYASRLR